MRRLRSKKQYASPLTRAVAGDVASTSASASNRRRRRNEKKTTTTTDQDENENEDVDVVAKQIKQKKKRRGLPDDSVTHMSGPQAMYEEVKVTTELENVTHKGIMHKAVSQNPIAIR